MTVTLLETEDFDSLSPLSINAVELTDTSLQWAAQIARTIPDNHTLDNHTLEDELSNSGESTQARRLEEDTAWPWQSFLQALAIAGFKQWLEEGAIALSGEYIHSTRPSGPNFQVGHYHLNLIAMGGLSEDSVSISIQPIAQENALPHLYVLIEVQEEINQVGIIAALRREQLLQHIPQPSEPTPNIASNITPDITPDIAAGHGQQTVSVPLSAFITEPEQLLLYLSCLEPIAETATVLESADVSVRELAPSLATTLINAHGWLQNQIDSVVEQMSWALLPPISPAMRPVQNSVDTALEVLANQGVQLPLQARGIGGPIDLESCTCQMYAWVWPVEASAAPASSADADTPEATAPDWMLFLLLGPRLGEVLPEGIQLQVSDGREILTQEVLAIASSEAYLYTQVQGTPEEQFIVKVTLPNGPEITLPTFTFESSS